MSPHKKPLNASQLQDGDELSFIWISAIHGAKETFVYLTEKIGSDKCVCIGNDKYFSRAIYFLPENRNDKEVANSCVGNSTTK